MHAYLYKRVRRFHWILLIIKVDEGIVQYLDLLDKEPTKYGGLVLMIDK